MIKVFHLSKHILYRYKELQYSCYSEAAEASPFAGMFPSGSLIVCGSLRVEVSLAAET